MQNSSNAQHVLNRAVVAYPADSHNGPTEKRTIYLKGLLQGYIFWPVRKILPPPKILPCFCILQRYFNVCFITLFFFLLFPPFPFFFS